MPAVELHRSLNRKYLFENDSSSSSSSSKFGTDFSGFDYPNCSSFFSVESF